MRAVALKNFFTKKSVSSAVLIEQEVFCEAVTFILRSKDEKFLSLCIVSQLKHTCHGYISRSRSFFLHIIHTLPYVRFFFLHSQLNSALLETSRMINKSTGYTFFFGRFFSCNSSYWLLCKTLLHLINIWHWIHTLFSKSWFYVLFSYVYSVTMLTKMGKIACIQCLC